VTNAREAARSRSLLAWRSGRPTSTAWREVLLSPFMAMPAWIVLVLALYPLGWSRLAAPLRWPTVVFLIAVAVVFVVLAIRVPVSYRNTRAPALSLTLLGLVTVYFVAAYVVNGGVPVLQIALGQPYELYGFGIPRLHVLMLTLTGYLAVRAFRLVLESHDRLALGSLVWLVLLLGSIANRSALSFLGFACLVIYLRARPLTRRHFAVLAVLGALGLYVFGWFGNLRLGYQLEQLTQTAASGDEILRVAGASDRFVDTGLSPAFLWGYTYLVSPVANLNEAFAHAASAAGGGSDVAGLLTFELLPDVLALKIAALCDLVPFDKSVFIISPSLTASTAFGSAVGYAGILGAAAVATLLAVVAVAVVRLLKGSEVSEEGLALLAALLFFSFFENMWSYSALSVQLVFPLAHTLLPRTWVHHRLLFRCSR
jgi:hypothetical protein